MSNRVAESRVLREELRRFRHRSELTATPSLVERLAAFLDVVSRTTPAAVPAADARPALRVVHWNILHGVQLAKILAALRDEPQLAGADLISLNEVDQGLARSGNRDVCAELAHGLGMHAAWSPLFLELEGGYRSEPSIAAAPQREALFGLGLLSRYPLGRVQRLCLDSPHDLLFERERKVGDFIALLVEVLAPVPFQVVVTHLDVHRTPAIRARQVQTILRALPAGPAILAGDMNTTTFERGNLRRSLKAFAVLAGMPSGPLKRRLLQPYRPAKAAPEPLFAALRQAGFEIEPFNDGSPSLDLRLDELAEIEALPRALRRIAKPCLRWVERRGQHRLDWIAARGFATAAAPFTLSHLMRGNTPASDHAPIGCVLRLLGDGR